jgi:[ribosomal protein S18]-alanine N-acetyltransferase
MEAESRNGTLVIRPMSLDDIQRVHNIDLLSFSMPWSERSYRFELTENRNSQVLVAEMASPEGREVVGMIVLWVILDEAHVATIATHPSYRGRHIGRKLLANGLLAAYNRGARLAYLEVRRSNLTAQKLYERFGFYVAGERPRYYKDNNEDALLMTLDKINPEELSRLAE